jgi:hypothetical protein
MPTAVLVLRVAAVVWDERPLILLPAGLGRTGPWSPVLLVLGMVATATRLTRLAISGFGPDGSLPWLVLATLTGGCCLL